MLARPSTSSGCADKEPFALSLSKGEQQSQQQKRPTINRQLRPLTVYTKDMDERRVEARLVMIGRGMGTSPERIRDLEQQQREIEKQNPPTPEEAFSKVLSRGHPSHARIPTKKELATQALPQKGPRPALSHPAQRKTFGRDPSPTESIVLKG